MGPSGQRRGGVRNGNVYAHTRPMMCEGLHTWRKNSFLAMGSWRLPRVSLIQDIVGLGVSPISMENTNYGDSALNSLCSGFMSRWQRRRPNLVHCYLNLSGHPAAASASPTHLSCGRRQAARPKTTWTYPLARSGEALGLRWSKPKRRDGRPPWLRQLPECPGDPSLCRMVASTTSPDPQTPQRHEKSSGR